LEVAVELSREGLEFPLEEVVALLRVALQLRGDRL
jgi:hypothetical protein